MPEHAGITFTLDLESSGDQRRHVAITRRLIDRLAELGVRGTAFVVGEDAQEDPELVRAVAAAGHEIGLHGWNHAALTTLDPATLRGDLARGKGLLEDLSGGDVVGFRAPMFSLVPASRWATDLIADAGFSYSSSVLPARSPLFGDPTVPRGAFRWPNGLLELPCPVAGLGSFAVPYMGGVYLRVLPWPAVKACARRSVGTQVLWTYCHPYDFDADEPYHRVTGVGRLGSRLLWLNRHHALARLEALLRDRAAPPLRERLDLVAPRIDHE
jgi:polysaccharide deacetylase family protein (PEP-CTERM system associated)